MEMAFIQSCGNRFISSINCGPATKKELRWAGIQQTDSQSWNGGAFDHRNQSNGGLWCDYSNKRQIQDALQWQSEHY